MWVDPDDDPRETDVQPSGERETLLEYLRVYRLTIRMKCDGLTPDQLATRSVPPSTMSLLGLIRHLARVEQDWFRNRAAGSGVPRLFWTPENGDLDFDAATGDEATVASAWAAWETEVDFAERFVAEHRDLDEVYDYPGGRIALREILVHLIEEYARHCGHADLLRECVDGRTGQ
jgi:uncharacterized damage-inducible protein DinB